MSTADPLALVAPLAGSLAASSLVASVAAAAAAALLWPAGPASSVGDLFPSRRRAIVLAGVGLTVLVVRASGGVAVPVLLGMLVAAAGVVLRRRAVGLRSAERRGEEVLQLCDEIAGDLAAGAAPALALTRAASRWPAVAPVATAHELGGHVPGAFRALADEPGAADLHLVAAAWQVAERTGAPLAEALAAVADGVREQRRVRRVVTSELASARATARLMAVLPLLTLAAGSGAGDPVGFLLDTPAGLLCSGLGLTLAVVGVMWIEAIAGAVQRDAAWSAG